MLKIKTRKIHFFGILNDYYRLSFEEKINTNLMWNWSLDLEVETCLCFK